MKLFHCVVVLGAATGCGQAAGPASNANGGQSAGGVASGGASNQGGSCASSGFGGGVLFVDPGSACQRTRGPCDDPALPAQFSDCEAPQQFRCATATCTCDDKAPLAPTDCVSTTQFYCNAWDTLCGCYCDVSVPASEAECRSNGRNTWYCHSYDPPVGCVCQVPIL